MKPNEHRLLFTSMALAAIVSLNACGGGSHSTIVPASPHARTMAQATFVMHWPSKTSPAQRRHSLYLSPNTKSVLVEVNDDPTLNTTVNAPSTGSVSTVTINAPAGNDTITITTWDQQNAGGNELGQVTITQSIVAGTANKVNATVDGILEYVGISALPNSFLEPGTDAAGNPTFTLVGDVPQTFTIVGEDADKNVIVPPGDAPSLSMTSSSPAISVSAVSGKTNEYTVAAVLPAAGAPLPALKISGTDGLGNTLSAQYSVTESAAIYVGYEGPSGPSIVAYDQTGRVLTTTGSFSGIADVSGLTYDWDDHRIYVADHVLGAVEAYDTEGNAVSGFTPGLANAATALAYDSKTKQIYVVQGSPVNAVSAFTTSGAPVTLAGTFAGLTSPTGIMYDPLLDQLYVANDSYTPSEQVIYPFNGDGTSGTIGSPPAPTPQLAFTGSPGFQPKDAVYDGNNNRVYAVGQTDGGPPVPILREFDPDFGNTIDNAISNGLNGPVSMAFNALTSQFYVTNSGNSTISVYDDNGPGDFSQNSSVTFTPPNGQTKPAGIVIIP